MEYKESYRVHDTVPEIRWYEQHNNWITEVMKYIHVQYDEKWRPGTDET
jgi:homogentisate 1,2-dioxygenase